MDAVTRGTIASAVHRNSQDIDVFNGVVDKCAWWFLVAVGELGAGSKAMKRCSKVLMLKEVAAGQRPRQQLRAVRRILARQAAAECIFGAGGQCFTTTTTTTYPVDNGVCCASRRRNINASLRWHHFKDATYLAQPLLPRLATPSSHVRPISLEARSLSRHTNTTCHCCPASMARQHPVCKSRPPPLPYRLPRSMPLLLPPRVGSDRPVPNEK